MAGNFFRGTSAEQDSRWGGDAQLIQKMAKKDMFSKVFEHKVGSGSCCASLAQACVLLELCPALPADSPFLRCSSHPP